MMAKDGKMMEMVTAELEKVGLKKDQIDDYMVWGLMKLSLGVMKIKWSLKGNGFEGKEAKEKLDKIVALVTDKDADDLHEMMHKGDSCGCDGWKK